MTPDWHDEVKSWRQIGILPDEEHVSRPGGRPPKPATGAQRAKLQAAQAEYLAVWS